MKRPAAVDNAHFDSIADKYLQGRSGVNHLAYKEVIWAEILGRLVEYLPRDKAFRGLEAMCGDADGSLRLLSFFHKARMDAFDLSAPMVDAAMARAGKRVKIFSSDVLKFESAPQYDLAMVIGGLHHVPDNAKQALGNICASLKPGGIFLNLEPTHNNFIFRKVRERVYRKNALFDASGERGFTLREYNALLAECGFRIEHQCHPGLLGYVLYYNPDAFPFLNVGPPAIARAFARLDMALSRTFIGKYLSFATWTIARKIA